MKAILATAASALILGTGVALADMHTHELEFPMNQDVFLETFEDATVLDFELIDISDTGEISEDEFDQAVLNGIIEDPRL